jgi:large subunit ribosomal protein L21
MYAVVTTGGKQYRVEPGTTLSVEKLTVEPGVTVTFDRVLLIGDGDETTVGTPTVAGASVSGTVLGEERGPKIVIFKFKQKVKYRRHTGHRQHLTRVRIDEITASGRSARVEEAEETVAPARRSRTPKAAAEPVAEPAEVEIPVAETPEEAPASVRKSRRPASAKKAAEGTSAAETPTTAERADAADDSDAADSTQAAPKRATARKRAPRKPAEPKENP